MSRITRRDFVGMSAAGGLVAFRSDPAHLDRRRNEKGGRRPMAFYLTRQGPRTWRMPSPS